MAANQTAVAKKTKGGKASQSCNLFTAPLAWASMRPATLRPTDEEQSVLEDQHGGETTEETAERRLKELSVAAAEVAGCSACGLTAFADRSQQREHYKLDWHRYNLHQGLAGQEPLTEEAFDQMVEAGQADDVSLSGSDSEEDNEEVVDDPGEDDHPGSKNVVGRSDSNDGGSARRSPWLFFQDADDQLMSVLRVAVDESTDDEEDQHVTDGRLVAKLASSTGGRWAVLMMGGGHFAGAVFHRGQPLVHKTFHCYTVRKGQGGSQSAKDNKSGGSHPKSAGASLRRYNEASLAQHVKDIVSCWSDELAACDRIFWRAASGNRMVLFGGKEPPLDRKDTRLRTIPFPTRRATFREIQRVKDVLSTVRCHGPAEAYVEELRKKFREDRNGSSKRSKVSPTKKTNIRRSKSREAAHRPLPDEVQHLLSRGQSDTDSSQEDESDEVNLSFEQLTSMTDGLAEFGNTALPPQRRAKKAKKKKEAAAAATAGRESSPLDLLESRLVAACKSGNARELTTVLEELTEDGKLSIKVNSTFGHAKLTPLHLAASNGHKGIVKSLLKAGADPCQKDRSKKVPYQLCPDKETRNAFRSFRGERPDAHDWTVAQVPEPASAEAEERQREKRRQQRQVRKDKQKAEREEKAKLEAEEAERQRYLQLSDREKRALAAERRILARTDTAGNCQSTSDKPVLSRCFQCATDITGKVPFEYSSNVFCSVKCVRQHRDKEKQQP
jgi:hypothetical protein